MKLEEEENTDRGVCFFLKENLRNVRLQFFVRQFQLTMNGIFLNDNFLFVHAVIASVVHRFRVSGLLFLGHRKNFGCATEEAVSDLFKLKLKRYAV